MDAITFIIILKDWVRDVRHTEVVNWVVFGQPRVKIA